MWIKVCGMTTADAVAAALDAGVDAIGFVFAESTRRVTPEQAVQLAAPARGRVRCVAVSRHPDQRSVDDILSVFKPDILQTDFEDFQTLQLPAALEVLSVIRAGGVSPQPLPARFLFEGPVSGAGVAADWALARQLSRRAELILAGGLSPENVTNAIADVHPFGVDVSSGVESSPGIKSPERIVRFVRHARAAFRSLEASCNLPDSARAKENAS